jgi:hypothetical protein
MLQRPHISPYDIAQLDTGVGLQLDFATEAAFLRFGWDLHALSGYVVLPAMIRAAKTVFLISSKPQRNSAVGAKLIHQPDAILGVAECKQAF